MKNASGLAYFQLKQSAGDSTYTTGINITIPVTIGQKTFSLKPDSVIAIYHMTADSVGSVKIFSKAVTSNDVGTYTSTYCDSVYNTTAVVKRGAVKLNWADVEYALDGKFGISLLANSTYTNAYVTADAAKLYVTLRCFYHLP